MAFRLPKDVNNLAAAARDLGQSGDEENNFAVPNLIVDPNGNPIRSENPLSVQVENQKEVQDVQLTGDMVELVTQVEIDRLVGNSYAFAGENQSASSSQVEPINTSKYSGKKS